MMGGFYNELEKYAKAGEKSPESRPAAVGNIEENVNERERSRLYREATAMMGKVVWIPSANGKYELGRMISAPLKDNMPGQTEDLVLVQPLVKDGFEEDESMPPRRIRVKEFLSLQSDCKNNHPDLYYKKYKTEDRKAAEWLDSILKSKYKGDLLNIRIVDGGKDRFSNIYDIIEDGKKIRVTYKMGAEMKTNTFPVEMVWQWFNGDSGALVNTENVEDVSSKTGGFGGRKITGRDTVAVSPREEDYREAA